jgi:hypothetical protein
MQNGKEDNFTGISDYKVPDKYKPFGPFMKEYWDHAIPFFRKNPQMDTRELNETFEESHTEQMKADFRNQMIQEKIIYGENDD